jgi:transposase
LQGVSRSLATTTSIARDDFEERGIELVIPPKSNRAEPMEYDRAAYKRRNLIERCVNALEQFRRIATRYWKTARAFFSTLCIDTMKLWLKLLAGPSRYSLCIADGKLGSFLPK